MIRIRIKITLSLLFFFCISDVFACLYNVRDVGFADLLSEPYQLYFYVTENTPGEFTSAFKQISYAAFIDCNVKVKIVNIDHKQDNPGLEYFDFWNLQSCPSAILAAASGRSMVLPISDSATSFKESVWSALQAVLYSRAREKILQNIVTAYCVILIVDGKSETENSRIYNLVSGAAEDISKTMNQLPKRIDKPPYIIKISKESIAREKMLLWCLDMDKKTGEEPAIVILYGRGRRFGPVLTGEDISKSRLKSILAIIGLSCECGIDIKLAMGPQIPLKWGEKKQAEVQQYLGFDAENPMVKLEMSHILALNLSMDAPELIGSLDGLPGNYSEEKLKSGNRASGSRVSPSRFHDLIAAESDNSKWNSNFVLFFFCLIIVVVILAGGGFVLLRARARARGRKL